MEKSMSLEKIYQKRCNELQMQLDILEAHARRMEDAICEWARCKIIVRKDDPHGVELFKIAKKILKGEKL